MFSPKDPAEIITITFDFSALSASVSAPTISVTPVFSIDASASAILSGGPQVTGAQVKQLVQGGVSGAYYDLKCTVTAADGSKYVLSEILPVVSA